MPWRLLSHFFAYGLIVTLCSSCIHTAEDPRRPFDAQSLAPSLKSLSTSADLVGACAGAMHQKDQVKVLGGNPRTKLAFEHNGKRVTREEFHGAVKVHFISGDENNLSLTAIERRPGPCEDSRRGRHSVVDGWIQERG